MSAKNVEPSTKKESPPKFQTSLEFAIEEEEKDPLLMFQKEFYFPLFKEEAQIKPKTFSDGKKAIYFSGHSLGLQPKQTKQFLEQELQVWREKGVDGHFYSRPLKGEEKSLSWTSYDQVLEKHFALLLGAKEKEICLMNSLTVNLHLMMISFYRPNKKRHKILLLKDEFSSDRYALTSQVLFRNYSPSSSLLLLSPRPKEHCVREEDLLEKIEKEGEEIALIFIGNPNYLTGQAFDGKRIAKKAQAKGCLVGFDLAHGVGNLTCNLHEEGADFAVWCSYKYLNGGPGSIGGSFIHERHLEEAKIPRLSGWWGQEESFRFKMPFDFHPMQNSKAWKLSNPSIFQMAPLFASMHLFKKVGQKALRKKGERLTSYLEFLLKEELGEKMEILTPPSPSQRGSQLSLMFPKSKTGTFHSTSKIEKKLKEKGVFSDSRKDLILRVAPAPFYCSFTDVYFFVKILKEQLRDLKLS